MELMVVVGSEVDDSEEKGIPGPDAGSGGALPTFHNCMCSHLPSKLSVRFSKLTRDASVISPKLGARPCSSCSPEFINVVLVMVATFLNESTKNPNYIC